MKNTNKQVSAKQKAFDMYDSGRMTNKEIAAELGIAVPTLWRWMKEANYVFKKGCRAKRVQEAIAS